MDVDQWVVEGNAKLVCYNGWIMALLSSYNYITYIKSNLHTRWSSPLWFVSLVDVEGEGNAFGYIKLGDIMPRRVIILVLNIGLF